MTRRSLRRWLALLGGVVAGGVALASAMVSSQLPGCCGGSPNHSCNFVETTDAGQDQAASDAALNCPLAPCATGQSCCIDTDSPSNPVHCIAVGAACNGLTGSCRGDQDCPFGEGLHCCGNVDTLSTQCQSECSGKFETDGTVRVCASSAECPADRPSCGALMVGDHTFYGCVTARD